MSADFNPNSQDAIMAKLLAHAESQSEKMDDILARHDELGKRVSGLEKDKHVARGAITTVALLAPAAWDWVKGRIG